MNKSVKKIIIENELALLDKFPEYERSIKNYIAKIKKIKHDRTLYDFIIRSFSSKYNQEATYNFKKCKSSRQLIEEHKDQLDFNDYLRLTDLKEGEKYSSIDICAIASNFNNQVGMYYIHNNDIVIIKSTINDSNIPYEDGWIKKGFILKYSFQEEDEYNFKNLKFRNKPNRAICESIINNKKLDVHVFINYKKNEPYIYEGIFHPYKLNEDHKSFILIKEGYVDEFEKYNSNENTKKLESIQESGMEYLDKIVNIYKEEENDYINDESLESVKIAALYIFYHYYNADVTKLDEMNNQFCFLTGDINDVIAIHNNVIDENIIDFIFVLPSTQFIMFTQDNDLNNLRNYLKKINSVVANAICRVNTENNENIIKKLYENEITDNTKYNVYILSDIKLEINDKINYQRIAEEYKVRNESIKMCFLFNDDILEEVSDVESPKNTVQEGKFQLYNNGQVAYFGSEKSFLGFISARSLKNNYLMYSTSGLFASNLRYYVKMAKIDSQIVNTILYESENFCYYNNGIIVTCDDYLIENDTLTLYNFSIVNGGQTTNLIGITNFENDFPVMCKVIKNKYASITDKVDFLSKVAEASNTQKPIKAKDLIANRKEQRLLKMQYESVGVFLQIKRGEKIPKEIYSQPWQNATNDQVAQMIYSTVYQMPGSAKNAKSKLLENEKTYIKIFDSKYNSQFLVSLQHLKVSFNNWMKKVKKIEKKGSIKLGLAKNSDLFSLGVISLIYKLLSNKELFVLLSDIYFDGKLSADNEQVKLLLNQNDIGNLTLISENFIMNLGRNSFFDYFDFIHEEFLIPAYNKFVNEYKTYAYSHFVKSDLYYYNFVIPEVVSRLNSTIEIYNYSEIYDLSTISSTVVNFESSFNDYKPGLEEELKEYRSRISRSLNIKNHAVLQNLQLLNILKHKPTSVEELKRVVKFSQYQCDNFGEAICKIVKKYMSIDDYMG